MTRFAIRTKPAVFGFLIALVGYSLYTFGDSIMKALSDDYPLPMRMMVAYLSAAATLFIVAQFSKTGTAILKPHSFKVHLGRALIVLIAQASCLLAYPRMPLADVYAILYLMPLTVALLAGPILKEWPSKFQYIAIIFGWCGGLLIIRPDIQGVGLGTVYALVGMLFIAFNQLFTRRFGTNETGIGLSFSAQAMIGLGMIPFAFPALLALNIADALSLMFVGMCAGLAMMMVTEGARIAPAGRAAPAIYVQILWGLVFGVIFFSDAPNSAMLLGALVIIGAGLLLIWDRYRKRP